MILVWKVVAVCQESPYLTVPAQEIFKSPSSLFVMPQGEITLMTSLWHHLGYLSKIIPLVRSFTTPSVSLDKAPSGATKNIIQPFFYRLHDEVLTWWTQPSTTSRLLNWLLIKRSSMKKLGYTPLFPLLYILLTHTFQGSPSALSVWAVIQCQKRPSSQEQLFVFLSSSSVSVPLSYSSSESSLCLCPHTHTDTHTQSER